MAVWFAVCATRGVWFMVESLALRLIARAEEQLFFFSSFVFGIGAPERGMYVHTYVGWKLDGTRCFLGNWLELSEIGFQWIAAATLSRLDTYFRVYLCFYIPREVWVRFGQVFESVSSCELLNFRIQYLERSNFRNSDSSIIKLSEFKFSCLENLELQAREIHVFRLSNHRNSNFSIVKLPESKFSYFKILEF